MDHIIGIILLILVTLLGLVLQAIGFADGLLSAALGAMGVPPAAQAWLLVIAAIVLGVAALRLLGGLVAWLLIVLLALLLLQPHLPHNWLPHHAATPPPALNLPGPHVSL